jgi:hypothetical protein
MNMRIALLATLLAALLACHPAAEAREKGFTGLQCGADIPKLLVGRTMPNERVVVTESRYKNLGLRDLGATELDAGSNAIWWLICGTEIVELEDSHSVVKDVLSFKSLPSQALLFEGSCTVNNAPLRDEVVAVLADQPGHAMLPATEAWTINEAKGRFIPLSPATLLCPRGQAHAVGT